MPEETPAETPDGAAVFPMIPEELGVHPLLRRGCMPMCFSKGPMKSC